MKRRTVNNWLNCLQKSRKVEYLQEDQSQSTSEEDKPKAYISVNPFCECSYCKQSPGSESQHQNQSKPKASISVNPLCECSYCRQHKRKGIRVRKLNL